MTERCLWVEKGIMPTQSPANSHWLIYKLVSGFLNKTDEVLDVGCGCGAGSVILSEKCKSVFAIDNAKEAIEYAEKSNQKHNIKFVKHSIENFLENNKDEGPFFDKIFAIEVIEHLDNPKEKIKGLYNMLNPFGMLVISFPVESSGGFHKTNFTRKNVHTFFEGLPVQIRTIEPGNRPANSQNFLIMVSK